MNDLVVARMQKYVRVTAFVEHHCISKTNFNTRRVAVYLEKHCNIESVSHMRTRHVTQLGNTCGNGNLHPVREVNHNSLLSHRALQENA